MGLQVEIKKLSQDVSMEDGEAVTQNFVLFELPNGGMVKAAIDEVAADALLDAFVRGASSQKVPQQHNGYIPPVIIREKDTVQTSSAIPNGFHEGEAPDGSRALVFGGDGDDRPVVEPESTPVPQPKPKVGKDGRVVAVGKTEMGYPILKGQGNLQDPGEISNGLGQDGSDEDGVASV